MLIFITKRSNSSIIDCINHIFERYISINILLAYFFLNLLDCPLSSMYGFLIALVFSGFICLFFHFFLLSFDHPWEDNP